MIITKANRLQRKYLDAMGLGKLDVFSVDDHIHELAIQEARRHHPEESEEEIAARALARAAYQKYQNVPKATLAKIKRPFIVTSYPSIIAIILFILLLLCASRAHGQVVKTDVVRAGGTAVGASGLPVAQATGTNLHMVCDSGCGGAASFADRGAFTFGTTSINTDGCVFDDTPPADLTAGMAGVVRCTPKRSFHVNLRNQAGTEIGTASNPVVVGQATGTNLHIVCDSGCGGAASFTDSAAFTFATTSINNIAAVVDDVATNTVAENSAGAVRMNTNRILYIDLSKTAANTNKLLVTPDSVALPANQSVNVNQLAGTTTSVNSGTKDAGTLRVVLATDQPALTNKLLVTPDSVALPANQSVNVNQIVGTTADVNSGVKSAGTLRVVLATDQPALTNKLLVTPDSVALPANQSVNVNQLAGTATDTNSGTKSAGTLRVVLATDQPALTNKLLVTPDSVALPANQSVNVSQMNGVTVTMGAGATGTGVQRTNDVASSATAAAVPASAAYTGGTDGTNLVGFFVDPCAGLAKTYTPVNIATATTSRFAAPAASKKTYICSIVLVAAAADNVNIIEGTGGTCGTGTAGVAGGTTAATGFNLAANGGLTLGNGASSVMATAGSNVDMCLITSAAVQLSGHISWVQR